MMSLATPPTRTRRVAPPRRADVLAAHERLRPLLEPTPVVPCPELGALLKLEVAQPTGSFKVRGALNALARLPADEPVVTASAGNHGLGIAYAAAELGRDATVVVPVGASRAKLAALERFPVTLVPHGLSYDEAERHALELAGRGARFVSPYNDTDVVAGQGTVGLELAEQVAGGFTVVCPVGGGGLAAGVALALAGRRGVRVVGVEAAHSTAMRAALDAGRIVPIEAGSTIADGLGGNLEPGSVTVELVRRHVAEVVAVEEEEIREAMRFLAARHGLVVEGAAAVATAALLAGRVAAGGRTIALVTGRNVDLRTLGAVFGDVE